MFSNNKCRKTDRRWIRHSGWLVSLLVFLSGCSWLNWLHPDTNTLDRNTKYAVYYYSPTDKIVSIEVLNPPHSRKAGKLTGTEPALPALCDPTAFPPKPQRCQGNSCPVDGSATYAVYYGEGDTPNSSVKAIGVEKGPFTGRMVEWPTGSGCVPACTKKCCAPSGGGCICIC